MPEDRIVAFHRHRFFVPGTLATSLLLLVLGSYFAWIRPGHLVDAARSEASEKITQATSKLEDAKKQIEGMGWFVESYSAKPTLNVKTGEALLTEGPSSAKSHFAAGEVGTWRSRIRSYNQASKVATDAYSNGSTAIDLIKDAERLRDEAIKELALFTKSNKALLTLLDQVDRRGSEILPTLPSRYSTWFKTNRDKFPKDLSRVESDLTRLNELLPKEGTKHRGDPAQALPIGKGGNQLVSTLLGSAQKIDERLVELRTHRDQAVSSVTLAEGDLVKSRGYFDVCQAKTGYWFKDALEFLEGANADSIRGRTLLTLVAPNEKFPDLPEAFVVAERSRECSKRAIKSVDDTILLANSARQRRLELRKELDSLRALHEESTKSASLANSYHNLSTWQEYQPVLGYFSALELASNQKLLKELEDLCRLDRQEFAKADALAADAIALVRSKKQTTQSFIRLVVQLENLRKQYPSELSAANSAINKEQSLISEYGDEDATAKGAFNNGVASLAHAKALAGERLYARAIEAARAARSYASGTGEKAKAAYDDRIASERRRSSNDWDFGGGGYSSDSDSSSGGGFSSGSDSSYDSGSDSSWGSGSDSSWDSGSDSDW